MDSQRLKRIQLNGGCTNCQFAGMDTRGSSCMPALTEEQDERLHQAEPKQTKYCTFFDRPVDPQEGRYCESFRPDSQQS